MLSFSPTCSKPDLPTLHSFRTTGRSMNRTFGHSLTILCLARRVWRVELRFSNGQLRQLDARGLEAMASRSKIFKHRAWFLRRVLRASPI